MNERLKSPSYIYEVESTNTTSPRVMGETALHVVNEDYAMDYSREELTMNQENNTVERSDGAVYAQDQEEYKPFAAEATAIIMAAVSGDFEALGRIGDLEIREALHIRIESHGGDTPPDEIEKMISVACGTLARSAYGKDFDKAA